MQARVGVLLLLIVGVTGSLLSYREELRTFDSTTDVNKYIFGGTVGTSCLNSAQSQANFNITSSSRYYRGNYYLISGGAVVRFYLTVASNGACSNTASSNPAVVVQSGNSLFYKRYPDTVPFSRYAQRLFVEEVFDVTGRAMDYLWIQQLNFSSSGDYWALDNVELACKHRMGVDSTSVTTVASTTLSSSTLDSNFWSTADCNPTSAGQCGGIGPWYFSWGSENTARQLTTKNMNVPSGGFLKFTLSMGGTTSASGFCQYMPNGLNPVFLEYKGTDGNWVAFSRFNAPLTSSSTSTNYEIPIPREAWASSTPFRFIQYCNNTNFPCTASQQTWSPSGTVSIVSHAPKAGYADYALQFTDAADSAIVEDNTSFSTGFTVESWVYVTGGKGFLMKGDSTSAYLWKFGYNSGNLWFSVNSGAYNWTSTGTLSTSTWTHVAVVYTRDNGSGKSSVVFYIGGVASNPTVPPTTIVSLSTSFLYSNLVMGSLAGELFQGALDEVRVWTTNLTAADITTYKSTRPTTAPSSLAVYFRFVEGNCGDFRSSLIDPQIWGYLVGPTSKRSAWILSGAQINISPYTIAIPADSTKNFITLEGADAETVSSELQYYITTIPTRGTLYVTDGVGVRQAITGATVLPTNVVAYDPVWGQSGSSYATFAYKVYDGQYYSSDFTMVLNVVASSHRPTASWGRILVTSFSVNYTVNMANYASDVDSSSTFTYYITQGPTVGALFQSDGTQINTASGTVTVINPPNLIYQPIPSFTTVKPFFLFTVSDGTYNSTVAEIEFLNSVIAVTNDLVSTSTDQQLIIDPTANDYIPDGYSATVTVYSPTSNGGTVIATSANKLVYTPKAAWSGTDTIIYTLKSGAQAVNGTVTVTVTALYPTPPTVSSFSVTTQQYVSPTIVLAGSEPYGLPYSAVVTTLPTKGTLYYTADGTTTVSALSVGQSANYLKQVIYVQSPSLLPASGIPFDSFQYKWVGQYWNSSVATVTINVTAVNQPPVAYSQNLTATEDTALNVYLNATDPENNTLTYTISAMFPPFLANITSAGIPLGVGSVVTDASKLVVFTPTANLNGYSTWFQFTASDGSLSSTATVTITNVTAVNDPPVANSFSVTGNAEAYVVISLIVSDIDSSGLQVYINATPTRGSLMQFSNNATIVAGTAVTDNQLRVVYTSSVAGTPYAAFTYSVTDGTTFSNLATVTLNINAINHAPTVSNLNLTTNENVNLTVCLNGSDPDSNPLTAFITLAPTVGTLYQSVNGVGSGIITGPYTQVTNTSNCVIFQPVLYAYGLQYDRFQYLMWDTNLTSNEATVSIDVTFVNQPPVAIGGTASGPQDQYLKIILNGTDVDTPTPLLVPIITALPTAGSLYQVNTDGSIGAVMTNGTNVTNARTVAYRRSSGYGNDVFQFSMGDGQYWSPSVTVGVTITFVNYPPVASDLNVTTTENNAVPITLPYTNSEPDTITFVIIRAPFIGTLKDSLNNPLNNGSVFSSATVTFTPQANTFGFSSPYATFSFKVYDGVTYSNEATVSVNVTFVNQAPTAGSFGVFAQQGINATFRLQANDVDTPQLNLRAILTSTPTRGQLYQSNGVPITGATVVTDTLLTLIFWSPETDTGYPYADFTYVVTDGSLNSTVATVTINVTNINHAPTVQGTTLSVNGTENVYFNITLQGTDQDGDSLTFYIISPPVRGYLYQYNASAPNNAGAWINNPETQVTSATGLVVFVGEQYQWGNPYDSFYYRVQDPRGLKSAIQQVNVSLAFVPTPVQAYDTSIATLQDVGVLITLTGKSVDFPNNTLTFKVTQFPLNGNLFNVDSGGNPVLPALSSGSPQITEANRTSAISIRVYFKPQTLFFGSVNFLFNASDGNSTGQGSCSILVNAVNHAPVAYAAGYTIAESTSITVILNGTDVDTGTQLTATVTQLPSKGVLYNSSGVAIEKAYTVVADRNVTYTPTQYLNGAPFDSFEFFVSDGTVDSSPVTVSFNVTPVPNPPTAIDSTFELDENRGGSFSLLASDPDIGDVLNATLTSLPDPTRGTLSYAVWDAVSSTWGAGTPITANNTMVGMISTYLFYTPANSQWGIPYATLNFTVYDGMFTSNEASVTINVKPLVYPPTVYSSNITMDENTQRTITLNGTDANGFTISAIITVLPTQGVLYQTSGSAISTPGTLVSSSNHTLVYQPKANGYAVGDSYDAFEFQMDNGLQTSDSAVVTIWVTNVPVAATVTPPNITIAENTGIVITVDVADPTRENNITVFVDSLPTRGKLYQTDGQNPKEEITSPNTAGIYCVARGGDNTGSICNMFYFVPATYGFGWETPYVVFNIRANNGWYDTPSNVTVWVTPVNNPPIVNNMTLTLLEDTPKTIVFDAWDPDNTSLQIIIDTIPLRGTLTQDGNNITETNTTLTSADNTAVFQPYANENDQNPGPAPYAMFYWYASDGVNFSPMATVTLYVTPVNDAPTAYAAKYSMRMDATLGIQLSGSDIETPLDNLNATIVSLPSRGTLYQATETGAIGEPITVGNTPVQNKGFTVYFIPGVGGFGAQYASFTFNVFDGELYSNVAEVDIQVTQNHAPTADPTSQTAPRNQVQTLTLKVKDQDKGDPLEAIVLTLPTRGTLCQVANNVQGPNITSPNTTVTDSRYRVMYIPPTWEYSAVDSDPFADFTYQGFDGLLYSNEATATVYVRFQSFSPIPDPISQNCTESLDGCVITLNAFSPDDKTLESAQISTMPTLGKLYLYKASSRRSTGSNLGDEIKAGTPIVDPFKIVYVVNKYAFGVDHFGYKFKDKGNSPMSNETIANITVPHINHAPEIYNATSYTPLSTSTRLDFVGYDGDGDYFFCTITELPVRGSLWTTRDGNTPATRIETVPFNVTAGFYGGTFFVDQNEVLKNGSFVVFYQAPSFVTNDTIAYFFTDDHAAASVVGVNMVFVEVAQASSSSSQTAAIAGGVVGGVVLVALAVVGAVLYRKRKDNYGALANLILGDTPLDELQKILLEQNLVLVKCIAKNVTISEQDELASAYVCVFEANKQSTRLLKTFIHLEVAATENSNLLFRSNSVTTKLLKMYTRKIGGDYLKSTLKPLIESMITSGAAFEIDPVKLPPGQSVEQNLVTLKTWTQAFFDAIQNSSEKCPYQFREICSFMQAEVTQRFPLHRNKHTFTGGLIFLRFFCPAIVAPEAFGVVTGPVSPDVRRGLVLISKSLQNLANSVQFGSKEPFMKPMNEFIVLNLKAVKSFLELLATLPEGRVMMQQIKQVVTYEERLDAMMDIYRCMCEFWKTIKTHLEQDTTHSGIDSSANLITTLNALKETDTEDIANAIGGNDTWVILKMSGIVKTKELATAIGVVTESKGKIVPLLKCFITEEVLHCASAHMLFRENTMAAFLMLWYVRSISVAYLQLTLGHLVGLVCSFPDNYEIDPTRLGPDEDLKVNRRKLKDTCTAFLLAILNSVKHCPMALRELYKHVQNEAGERFGERRYAALASFVFGRLLCPAIARPDQYGIWSGTLDEKATRALTLVSKILQSMANGTELGAKEPYMAVMKKWASKNIESLRDFFYNVVNVADGAYIETPRLSLDYATLEKNTSLIHRTFVANRDKLTALLMAEAKSASNLVERLTSLMEDIGPPKPRRRKAHNAQSGGTAH